ncbi:5-oxoprolinase subunit PxpA [Aliivibrio sp. S10_S31]|uniref:5-oxoprolinase subunit PxpA n=1 Tax=Aliivibrio sp. S10_S31 TaxID=2720224 RepID=UPI001681B0BF|nr:5-oxoprolinase subunit PxpA [Aliivibrio sp. S10_S31]MBD1569823.1 LamB/YcsF family protein [Aliivibrio sp. S10_S31]
MRINCDMGESFGLWQLGNDSAVMPALDMANIACGMHASDPSVMMKTVALAKAHGVAIGAHPGYNDIQGFGRRDISMDSDDLAALFIYQLGALEGICQSQQTSLSYVKPHGALYNAMMKNDVILQTLLEALKRYDVTLPLVIMAVPDHQRYVDMANEYGITLWFEAFVDRAYDEQGRLVPRSIPGSSHHSDEAIQKQANQLIDEGCVTTLNGDIIKIHADTLCIHGDGPFAVSTAEYLRKKLKSKSES